jgi:cytochrome P450
MDRLGYVPFLGVSCGVVLPRTNVTMQEERLWVADPKAIHRILQGPNYLYQKPSTHRVLMATVLDRGLSWSEGNSPLMPRRAQSLILNLGDVHKRHRRAMIPAFGLVEAKALYPCFTQYSNLVSHRTIHV